MPIPSTVSLVSRTASLKSNIEALLENKTLLLLILCYLFIISIVALSMTCYDKWAAKKKPAARTRESSLILISALGGSLIMLLTMIAIRHKTRHIKFMLGIPLILLVQLGSLSALLLLL